MRSYNQNIFIGVLLSICPLDVIYKADLKDRIITDKVLRLIDLDLVEVIEPKIDEICNILNSFLVKHNSKAGAQFITGKADKNDANAIDPSSWGKNSKISR